MNYSNCKKTLVVLCGLLCSIPHTFAQTKENVPTAQTNPVLPESFMQLSDAEKKEFVAALIKELDSLYQQVLTLFQGIDSMLEEIALMVQNKLIKPENNKDFLQKMGGIRQLIDSIRRDTQVNVEPEALYTLLILHKALMEYVEVAAKNQFKSFPAFDIQAFLTNRHIPVDLSIELIQETVVNNSHQLKNLHEKSTTLGLTWYNKFFRKCADLDFKYKVFTVGGKLALTGGAWALYLAYATGYFYESHIVEAKDPNGNPILDEHGKPEKLRITNIKDKFKKHWYTHFLGFLVGKEGVQAHRTTQQEGILGNLDAIFHDGRAGLIPFGTFLGMYTYNLWRPEIEGVQDVVSTAGSLIWGRLQGGIEQVSAEKEALKNPTITFDDVVGLDYVKEVLMDIVRYIEDPERFDLLKMAPEKGFLLVGPSRTGKSWIAEALGGEIQKMLEQTGKSKDDVRFFHIEPQLIMKHGIRHLLNLAENTSPCVLFIDEIDLLGLQRAGGNLELLGDFLASLSGFQKNNPRKKVIVVAATNKPENIDEALRKRGRFGKIIHFDYPTYSERKEYMLRRFNALAINPEHFDLELLIQETENCSFEDLNVIFNSALKKAKLLGMPLTQELLFESLQEEILNIIMKSTKNVTDREMNILAAQIAGRALANILLHVDNKLSCATIRPIATHITEKTVFERLNKNEKIEKEADSTLKQSSIKHGAIFTHFVDDHLDLQSRESRLNECKVLLAGNAAEKVLLGSCGYSYRPEDREKALEIIKPLIFSGTKEDSLSKNLRNQYLDECITLLKQCEQEVYDFLELHKNELQAVSDAIKKHQTLSARQINEIVEKLKTK